MRPYYTQAKEKIEVTDSMVHLHFIKFVDGVADHVLWRL